MKKPIRSQTIQFLKNGITQGQDMNKFIPFQQERGVIGNLLKNQESPLDSQQKESIQKSREISTMMKSVSKESPIARSRKSSMILSRYQNQEIKPFVPEDTLYTNQKKRDSHRSQDQSFSPKIITKSKQYVRVKRFGDDILNKKKQEQSSSLISYLKQSSIDCKLVQQSNVETEDTSQISPQKQYSHQRVISLFENIVNEEQVHKSKRQTKYAERDTKLIEAIKETAEMQKLELLKIGRCSSQHEAINLDNQQLNSSLVYGWRMAGQQPLINDFIKNQRGQLPKIPIFNRKSLEELIENPPIGFYEPNYKNVQSRVSAMIDFEKQTKRPPITSREYNEITQIENPNEKIANNQKINYIKEYNQLLSEIYKEVNKDIINNPVFQEKKNQLILNKHLQHPLQGRTLKPLENNQPGEFYKRMKAEVNRQKIKLQKLKQFLMEDSIKYC